MEPSTGSEPENRTFQSREALISLPIPISVVYYRSDRQVACYCLHMMEGKKLILLLSMRSSAAVVEPFAK